MADTNPRAWLKPILKTVRPIYREVAAMSLFVNTLALATPVFVLQVYDRVVYYAGLSTLKGLVLGMAIVIAFDFVLRQTRARMLQKAAVRLDVHVGRRLFEKVLALPLLELERRPAPFWQSLFRDVEVVRNTLSGPSALLLMDLPFAVLFLALVFVIATPIAWVLLTIVPLFLFLAARSGHVLTVATEEERARSLGREMVIAELVGGRATVKAMALDRSIRGQWEESHAKTIEQSLYRGSRSDSYVNVGVMFAVITTVSLTTVGALAIIDQRMTVGALIATNILASRIIGPFNQLVGSWRNYTAYRQAVTRLGEVFKLAQDEPRVEVELARPRGVIELDDVSFRYAPNSEPAIDHVKAQIKPPGLLAVIGPNGSGKTTLLKLMQGLYPPSEGRVLLDGADIKQFTRHQMARWIGYVPQECFLFSGTIRDNLVKGFPEASDEDMLRAATIAGLHRHVVDLPDGYGTEVGEGGMRLPGGLRQRIAVARALVSDPAIVLMDEPSSNLDREGEVELRDNLVELAKQRTVVVVSHSPVLLTACRLIVVMERGRIVRGGAPHEVLPELFAGRAAQGMLRREA